MASIDVSDSTLGRLNRYAAMFNKPITVVLDEVLQRAGLGTPDSLHTVETARLYLEVVGFDPKGIADMVAAKILAPAVVVGLMEVEAVERRGRWFPACGGTEVPCHGPSGRGLYLYCYQPSTHRHAYLALGEDRFFEDAELSRPLGG